MKVLITGSSGFIGSRVVGLLERSNIDYIAMGRGFTTRNGITTDLITTNELEYIIADIGATHLIHLAWYTEHGAYWNALVNLDWVRASVRLVDAFYRAGGKHALVAGTCAEYAWNDELCREGITPEQPATLYGESKHAAHRLCRILQREHGTSLAWSRLFFPYGPGESSQRLIPSLFRVFAQHEQPFGVQASSQRDFLSADDVAEALFHCSRSNFDGTLNISSGTAVSIESVVREIAELCGRDPDAVLSLQPIRKAEAKLVAGDNSILKSLGWSQRVELQDGLRSYFNEYVKGQR
jgi:nucleoside-diphosphate-sugar epimerase